MRDTYSNRSVCVTFATATLGILSLFWSAVGFGGGSTGAAFAESMAVRSVTTDQVEFVRSDESGSRWQVDSQLIDGAVGGAFEAGVFRLEIAPGAFEGEREISLIDSTTDLLECRILPEGLSTGGRALPTVQWPNRGAAGPHIVAKTKGREWLVLRSTSSDRVTLQAALDSFSRCRLGWIEPSVR